MIFETPDNKDPKKSDLEDRVSIVGSTFNDVVRYATTSDGALDLQRMQKLEGRYGTNGGRECDVQEGPCSCGAWH